MGFLDDKEQELEKLSLDEEIETKRVSIAQKKALEREAKAKYGRDWKKLLGLAKGLRPNKEVMQDLYAADLGGLKEAGKLQSRRLR